MPYMQVNASDTDTVLIAIKQHFGRMEFYQALEVMDKHWGAVREWRTPEQYLIGARVMSNLGLHRKARAIRLMLWRRYPKLPHAIYYHASYRQFKFGPLDAINFCRAQDERIQNNSGDDKQKLRAQWLALQAHLYAEYRDWEKANGLMQEAINLKPNDPWILVEKSHLLEKQDDYQGAWQVIGQALRHPYRPALQFAAHVKVLLESAQAAKEFLAPYLNTCESISLALQLFNLCNQCEDSLLAEQCLERAKQLVPVQHVNLDQELNIAAFEFAYQAGKYREAHAYLKESKTHFYRSLYDNISSSFDEENTADKVRANLGPVQLPVPFVRQHHMTCAPATLTALAKYWQRDVDHLSLVDDICYDGTSNQAGRRWAKQAGWIDREFTLRVDVTIALIDAGIPFTLSTVSPGSAHMQAVIGYDLRKKVYLVRDPYYSSVQEFLIDELGEQCRSSGPRCMALAPEEQRAAIEKIRFPDSELYDSYFDLMEALEQHDRQRAQERFQTMSREGGEHRIVLNAQRALSRYDGDIVQELKLVKQLAEMYPDDLNLQVDIANLLAELGQEQEKITYLEKILDKPNPHPMLMTTLANALSHDARQNQETNKLFAQVLRRDPTRASALWGYAGVLWNQRRYEDAYEVYRLCACLEDKVEGYISSYFKAARYLKRTDEALRHLEKRVEHLGPMSSRPYETLYYALEGMSRYPESIAVLENAYEAHPSDDRVIAQLIHAYLYNSLLEKSQSVLEANQAKLSRPKFLELSAAEANFRRDWQSEIDINNQRLEQSPYDIDLIESQARLLGCHYGDPRAIAFIDDCLKKNINNFRLQLIKLDWLCDLPYAEQIEYALSVAQIHPRECEIFRRLSLLYRAQGDLTEAEVVASTAFNINPYSTSVVSELGHVHFAQGQIEKAERHYRDVIESSVDAEGAFYHYIKCFNTIAEKRSALAFIYDQLMRQTSYGNGILEYSEVARDYLADEKVLEFLLDATKVRPDLWHAWLALAMHYSAMDSLDEALSTINKGIDAFPLIPRLYTERANIHFSAQNFAAAEQDCREAIKNAPVWSTAIMRLADVLEAQQKFDEAEAHVRDALIHSPTNSSYYGYLADYLVLKGDTEGARKQLEKALELNPQYDWAWKKYRECLQSLAASESSVPLIRKLLERNPHSTYLWNLLAESEENPQERLSILAKALEISPKNVELNLTLCRAYFQLGKIDKISSVVSDPRWQGSPSPALPAYEAWVEANFNRYQNAITIMQSVVDDNPAYYDGWRLLSTWSSDTGEHSKAVKYVDQCVKLFPHSAEALVFAAETYGTARENGVDIDAQEVKALLRKAVVLNPRDTYNALTYLDYLFETDSLDELEEAFATIIIADDNPYFLQRLCHYALVQGDLARALAHFRRMLACAEDNYWLLSRSLEIFKQFEVLEAFIGLVEELLADDEPKPSLGQLWMDIGFLKKESSQILEHFAKLPVGSDLYLEGLESIFSIQNYGEVTEKVLADTGDALLGFPRAWGLVLFYYVRQGQWGKVLQWGSKAWQKEDNEAWAVYFYGFALRLENRYSEAEAVNRLAAKITQQREDDYYDRIILWRIWDDVNRNGDFIDDNELRRVRYDELAAVEQYLFRLLCVIAQVQKAGAINRAADGVFTALENAKMEHIELLQESAPQVLKRQARRYLNSKVEGGAWLKLRWRFKLFNLM